MHPFFGRSRCPSCVDTRSAAALFLPLLSCLPGREELLRTSTDLRLLVQQKRSEIPLSSWRMEYFVSRTVLTREFIEEMYFIVLFYNMPWLSPKPRCREHWCAAGVAMTFHGVNMEGRAGCRGCCHGTTRGICHGTPNVEPWKPMAHYGMPWRCHGMPCVIPWPCQARFK